MKAILLTALIFTLLVQSLHAATKAKSAPRHVTAISPTPVLNTPDFKKMFSGKIKLDPCQGVRPIEFIALAGTLFTVHGEQEKDGILVYRVTTNDYPYPAKTGFFVDARFVEPAGTPSERSRTLPELAEIQKRLLAALGMPYVWGGNVKEGVPLLEKYYPQGDSLAGVDCSGLLYEATNGSTPRNTSALISFGKPVPIAGLTAREIAGKLAPLDLVAWDGHVMMVLDANSIIESTMGCGGKKSGVIITPIEQALSGVMKTRHPADVFPKGKAGGKSFVVRRWFPVAAEGSP